MAQVWPGRPCGPAQSGTSAHVPTQIVHKPVCAGSLLREWSFWKSVGATAWASEMMDCICWSLKVTRTFAGGIGKPCNLFETLFGNF